MEAGFSRENREISPIDYRTLLQKGQSTIMDAVLGSRNLFRQIKGFKLTIL